MINHPADPTVPVTVAPAPAAGAAPLCGRQIGGRYVLERFLGRGGVADVYEAHDEQLERQVAIKILRAEWATDPRTVASFQREAELAARLHHPHLAQVYDGGTEGGLPYIVMERVPGAPLDGAAPDVSRAVAVGAQLASALAFVHAHGLLHCDVKPANVLVDAQGQAKLVDFGVAYPAEGADPLPQASDLAGTTQRLPLVPTSPGLLPYLAPERLAGGSPSPAADIYGLGAVLYTLLAGRPPYPGDTAGALAQAQQTAPPPLRQGNPAIPPALDALVGRAIAVDPARRFGSAEEMEAALLTIRDQSREATAAFAGAPPTSAAPPPRPPATYRPVPTSPPAPATNATKAVMPRWALPLIAVILLLGVLALGGSQLGGQHARAVAQIPPTATGPARPIAAPAAQPAPQLLGLTVDQALATLGSGGWTLVEAPAVPNSGVSAGLIVAQEPDAGTPLAASAPITVTTSLGPAPLPAAPPTQTQAPAVRAPAPPAGGNTGHGDNGKGKGKGKH